MPVSLFLLLIKISPHRVYSKKRDRYKEGTENKESGVILIKRKNDELIASGLRMARAQANKSRAEVANDTGINVRTLSTWEQTGCISLNSALMLADYYGIELWKLVGR